jgi:hypothetical protein
MQLRLRRATRNRLKDEGWATRPPALHTPRYTKTRFPLRRIYFLKYDLALPHIVQARALHQQTYEAHKVLLPDDV